MLIAYGIILSVVNLLWVMLNAVGLPGNWLLLLCTAGFAWWKWEEAVIHVGTLIALLVLALLGELAEFLLGAAGAARSGASRRGAIGAILGALVGGLLGTVLIPIPILGSIFGACGGAFIGAMLLELSGGKQARHAARVGQGAAWGRLWGTLVKLSIGLVMWLTATAALFI